MRLPQLEPPLQGLLRLYNGALTHKDYSPRGHVPAAISWGTVPPDEQPHDSRANGGESVNAVANLDGLTPTLARTKRYDRLIAADDVRNRPTAECRTIVNTPEARSLHRKKSEVEERTPGPDPLASRVEVPVVDCERTGYRPGAPPGDNDVERFVSLQCSEGLVEHVPGVIGKGARKAGHRTCLLFGDVDPG